MALFRQDRNVCPPAAPVGRLACLVALFVSGAELCFAPDLKLPKLPSLFQKSDTVIQEVAVAPASPADLVVLPGGELIISSHPFFSHGDRVQKMDRKGSWSPFPTPAMNRPTSGESVVFDSIMGMAISPKGVVWMVDSGRKLGTKPKLIAWDTRKDELVRVLPILETSLSPTSFLKNIVLDPDERHIYISDPADGLNAAIIVVDLTTGISRRLLEGHQSVTPNPEISIQISGQRVEARRPDGRLASPLTGVSPIAIDRKGEWLYYGPRNGASLFKIKTELLKRTDVRRSSLESQVVGVSPKPVCDSMVIDAKGRIYFGDILRGSIDYVSPEDSYLSLRVLARDPRIQWPSGLQLAPDGDLYFFSNQLHRSGFYQGGKSMPLAPFQVFKMRPLSVSRFGF